MIPIFCEEERYACTNYVNQSSTPLTAHVNMKTKIEGYNNSRNGQKHIYRGIDLSQSLQYAYRIQTITARNNMHEYHIQDDYQSECSVSLAYL